MTAARAFLCHRTRASPSQINCSKSCLAAPVLRAASAVSRSKAAEFMQSGGTASISSMMREPGEPLRDRVGLRYPLATQKQFERGRRIIVLGSLFDGHGRLRIPRDSPFAFGAPGRGEHGPASGGVAELSVLPAGRRRAALAAFRSALACCNIFAASGRPCRRERRRHAHARCGRYDR